MKTAIYSEPIFSNFENNIFSFIKQQNVNLNTNDIPEIVSRYQEIYKLSQNTLKNPERLKIVFLVTGPGFDGSTPFKKGLGGTESAVVYIARQLALQKNEVTVFTEIDRSNHFDGVLYEKLACFKDFAQNNDIDILICVREYFLLENLPAKIIIFWTGDDVNQINTEDFMKASINGKLTDKIFVVSNYQKKRFIEKFSVNDEKFYLTRNGINPEFFDKPIPRKKNKLIYTSTPYRGLEILLKLFPAIREQVPDAELDIYSSMTIYGITREEDLKKYGHLYNLVKSTEGVNLKEAIAQPQLAEALKAAYLLVYPNIYPETSCLSAIESQAAGTPVITSALGALPETVVSGQTGICIEGDAREITFQAEFIKNTIEILKDEKKWLFFSNNARERMFNNFSWKLIASEWLAEFQALYSDYSLLANFYGSINQITLQNISLTDPEKKLIYNLYGFIRENFHNIKLLILEKEILEQFLNSFDFPENIRIEIFMRLAFIFFLSGEPDKSDQSYISAINIYRQMKDKNYNLKNIDFAFYRLICITEENKKNTLTDNCLEALNYFPDSFLINFKYAGILIKQESFLESIPYLMKSEELVKLDFYLMEQNKNDLITELFYNLSYCYFKINNLAKSLSYLKLLNQASPGHPLLLSLLKLINKT